MDFTLPVPSRLVVHNSDYLHWIAGPQKYTLIIRYTVGISLLLCIQAEIYVFQVMWPPSWISDFRLRTHDYHLYNSRGMSVPKNMGVAIGISFLTIV